MLTADALLARADDRRVSDPVLLAAIAAATDATRAALVAAWKPRVEAGEAALITRLLAQFELSAMTANDPAELVAFIDALAPVTGRPDVFSHVEQAMASERPAVRAAVCARWLAPAEVQQVLADAQVDKLIRCAVAIAEAGSDGPDREAATAALREITHAGGRHALMDAIRHARTDRNRTLRGALYAGIARVAAPNLGPFLVERLFAERETFSTLMDALARALDGNTHRRVIQTLSDRKGDTDAVRAAALYADTLTEKRPLPAQLSDLAHTVLAWQPAGDEDAGRLRHVLELAVRAALETRKSADARAFLARARQLAAPPLSDYFAVDHGEPAPAALDAEQVERQLAALEARGL